jgi:chromosome segregation ATPase
MKYTAILILLVTFFGCGNQQKVDQLTEENQILKSKVKLLAEQSNMKDEFVEEYTKTVNEIYDNLENIRKREGFITKYSKNVEKDKEASIKDKMLQNIASMDSYIKNSKSQLKQLKSKIKNSQVKSSSFEEMVETLSRTIEEKESHIIELKEQVDKLYMQVAEVEEDLQKSNEIIEEQTEKINTAYYVIGTNKELQNKKIIAEKGGFLWFGKTKILASDLKKTDFTTTDISDTDSISIKQNIKDIKIISNHNPESYHLTKKDEDKTVLEIIDPDEFWKMKYLVVLAKN